MCKAIKVTQLSKTRVRRVQQGALYLLLVGVLALVGCGRGSSDAGGGGSSDAPASQSTRAAVPTMPAARFAAPTSMITPQSAEPEVEATAALSDAAALTDTEEITAAAEITATEEMTDTE